MQTLHDDLDPLKRALDQDEADPPAYIDWAERRLAIIIVKAIEERPGTEYGPYKQIIGEGDGADGTPAGELVTIPIWGAVLKSRVEELDVKVGDRLGIRFLGLKESAAGREYRNFRVERDDDAAPFA